MMLPKRAMMFAPAAQMMPLSVSLRLPPLPGGEAHLSAGLPCETSKVLTASTDYCKEQKIPCRGGVSPPACAKSDLFAGGETPPLQCSRVENSRYCRHRQTVTKQTNHPVGAIIDRPSPDGTNTGDQWSPLQDQFSCRENFFTSSPDGVVSMQTCFVRI